jgi:F-type H+-transporting ATPase subunit a
VNLRSIENNIYMLDPLAQFEIINIVFFGTLSVTNLVIILFFNFSLLQLMFLFAVGGRFNNLSTIILYYIARLVNKILVENTLFKREQYFSILLYLFLFIACANFIGMLPFSWAITNSFVVTFFLAFIHFFALNFMCIYEKGIGFATLFLPSGVPFVLAPLIVIIELVSYFSRIFSLSIRLFANISSGHALLKILIGFAWSMLSVCIQSSSGSYSLICIVGFIFPWFIVFLIFFLEILISFLQTYVFVILIAIYINDVTSDNH